MQRAPPTVGRSDPPTFYLEVIVPLTYIRTDADAKRGMVRVHYRDSYGQPRFFELSSRSCLDGMSSAKPDEFGRELIREVNNLSELRRPNAS